MSEATQTFLFTLRLVPWGRQLLTRHTLAISASRCTDETKNIQQPCDVQTEEEGSKCARFELAHFEQVCRFKHVHTVLQVFEHFCLCSTQSVQLVFLDLQLVFAQVQANNLAPLPRLHSFVTP
jgi:hypothetical protein